MIAILNGQKTIVLLDTGSTRNFMNSTLATSLKLQIETDNSFGVRVTNGQVIKTIGECKEVKFKMKGLHMKLNFNLLDLGGCGMVCGTRGVIGEMRWNFLRIYAPIPYSTVFLLHTPASAPIKIGFGAVRFGVGAVLRFGLDSFGSD